MKISQRISELLSGHDLHTAFTNGHNSVNILSGVMVNALCISSDAALYLCLVL